MDFSEFFEHQKAQKQIDKLAKKYKNRKIVLYGAGLYLNALLKNYDISKLPVIAIADRKFINNGAEECFGYKTLKPNDLKDFDFDLLIVTMQEYSLIRNDLKDNVFYDSKNEGVKIIPMIKKSFWERLVEIIEE